MADKAGATDEAALLLPDPPVEPPEEPPEGGAVEPPPPAGMILKFPEYAALGMRLILRAKRVVPSARFAGTTHFSLPLSFVQSMVKTFSTKNAPLGLFELTR